MTERIVIDTGPLVAFARAELLAPESLRKVGIYYHEALIHKVLEAIGELDTK